MYPLTNKNVRIRYVIEKANRKLQGGNFTYQDMADKFDSDDRTVYTWVSTNPVTQHLPSSASKKSALLAWINDGEISKYHNKDKK